VKLGRYIPDDSRMGSHSEGSCWVQEMVLVCWTIANTANGGHDTIDIAIAAPHSDSILKLLDP